MIMVALFSSIGPWGAQAIVNPLALVHAISLYSYPNSHFLSPRLKY